MATNPFGYGNVLPFTQAQFSNQTLFPSHWVENKLMLGLPTVYFPMVTPMQTELETNSGQNIYVPIQGQMADTTWPGLTVGTSITVGSYNVESISVTVTEAGRGLAMDRFLKQYVVNGMYPGNAENFVGALSHNFLMSWENTLRSLYLAGNFALTQVAVGSFYNGGVWLDSGGTGFAVAGTITDAIVDEALAALRAIHTGTLGTFVVPPYNDGLYRMVGNWATIKGIAKQADFKNLDNNTSSNGRRQIFQEVGEWNGFMWVRHELMPNGTLLAHGNNVCVQAFGGQFDASRIPPSDMVQINDPLPMQIRLEPDYQDDFYRGMAAAWYTVAGSSVAFRDMGTHAIRLHVAT